MEPIDILNNHNLKRTSCREGILEVVMAANQALSENEIKEQLAGNYDRTTFYRSFKTLEEHRIIHKIVEVEYKNCSPVWKAVKEEIKNDEKKKQAFIKNLKAELKAA